MLFLLLLFLRPALQWRADREDPVILEKHQLSPSARAYWQAALIYAASQGMLDYGARKAAKYAADEATDFALMLGGEVPTSARGKSAKDAVFLVRTEAASKRGPYYEVVASDWSKFKRALNKYLASYDPKDDRQRAAWATFLLATSVTAAVVVSVVATPAAGAAVGVAGSALAGVVRSGGSTSEIAAAVQSGAADASAALQATDPDAAAYLGQIAQAAGQIATTTDTTEPVSGVVVDESGAPVAGPLAELEAWAEDHPLAAGGVGLGLATVAFLAIRLLVRG